MNVLLLGWADLDKGTSEGGGYNQVAGEHALYLKKKGFNVYYLQSGRHYSYHWLFGLTGRLGIKKKTNWQGVDCYYVRNSLNRAPSVMNHHNQPPPLFERAQDRAIVKWIKRKNIHQVMIHSLEGQAFSLIEHIKQELSINVQVFCHDHYYLCSRVNFLYRGQTLCSQLSSDKHCSNCVPQTENRRYEISRYLELSSFPLLRKLHKMILLKKENRESQTIKKREIKSIPLNANEQLLKQVNLFKADDFFTFRRKAAIKALSCADYVYTPSSFLGGLLNQARLQKQKIHTVKIGLAHMDHLKKIVESRKVSNSGILTFCFRGSDSHHKGVSVFLDAITRMDPVFRKKCRFIIRGMQNPEKYDSLLQSIPELKIYGPYRPEELPGFMNEYHIGVLSHIWFENSPVTMLEHLASGKPVLAARLGGVVDFIREGENGWFFRPGDSTDLAAKMTEIANLKHIPEGISLSREIPLSKDFFNSLNINQGK